MDKLARKQSTDPAQEALREHKSQWNKAVSSFITNTRERGLTPRLIELKRALNGYPVPSLGLDKGDIKEPLPDIISQILDTLASEYQQITQEFSQIANVGKAIVHEQAQYSNARRQPMVTEQRQQVQATLETEIIKEASNPLTRLWTYLATPFRLGDKDRWARKNMLQTAAEINKNLNEIGTAVLSKTENSIPEAVLGTKNLVHLFNVGISDPLIELNKAKEAEKQVIKDTAKDIPEHTPIENESVKPKKPDYSEIKTVKLNADTFNQFLKGRVSKDVDDFDSYSKKYPQVVGIIIGKLPNGNWQAINIETREEVIREETVQAPEAVTQEQIAAPDLDNDQYTDAFEEIAGIQADFNKKHEYLEGWIIPTFNAAKKAKTLPPGGAKILEDAFAAIEKSIVDFQIAVDNHDSIEIIKSRYNDFNKLYELILKAAQQTSQIETQAGIDNELVKLAQANLSRWFKRQWVDLLKSRNYQFRLSAEKAVSICEKTLDKLMNALQEKNAPIDNINSLTISFADNMGELLKQIARLADNYNNESRIEQFRAKSEGKRTVINFINATDIAEIKRMIKNIDSFKQFVNQQQENKEEKNNED